MNTDLQKLNEITAYYNGLQKIAAQCKNLDKEAAGFGIALTAASRFAPKIFSFLTKFKSLKPVMAGIRGGLKSAGRSISSKSTFGRGFVEGLRGATTNKGRIVSKITKNMTAVPGSNIQLNNKAINKLWLGRNLGHFFNVNTWSPYNKGLLVDAPLWATAPYLLFGNENTNNAPLTPQEIAYYQGNPVYDNYGYGYGYNA